MKRSWSDLKYVMAVLRNKAKDTRLPPYVQKFYQNLFDRLEAHEMDLKAAILEAQMQGLRNPAFPDDLVGWLDDDFDDDDPFGGKKKEDGEDKKKKRRRRPPGHGRQPLPDHLPREQVIHELSEEERCCPCCGQTHCCCGHHLCTHA